MICGNKVGLTIATGIDHG